MREFLSKQTSKKSQLSMNAAPAAGVEVKVEPREEEEQHQTSSSGIPKVGEQLQHPKTDESSNFKPIIKIETANVAPASHIHAASIPVSRNDALQVKGHQAGVATQPNSNRNHSTAAATTTNISSHSRSKRSPSPGFQTTPLKMVFVNPDDSQFDWWWPALIVPKALYKRLAKDVNLPHDSGGKEGGNSSKTGIEQILVCYFEDGSFSVVAAKDTTPFSPSLSPYLGWLKQFEKRFLDDRGIQAATHYYKSHQVPPFFAWVWPSDNEFMEDQQHQRKRRVEFPGMPVTAAYSPPPPQYYHQSQNIQTQPSHNNHNHQHHASTSSASSSNSMHFDELEPEKRILPATSVESGGADGQSVKKIGIIIRNRGASQSPTLISGTTLTTTTPGGDSTFNTHPHDHAHHQTNPSTFQNQLSSSSLDSPNNHQYNDNDVDMKREEGDQHGGALDQGFVSTSASVTSDTKQQQQQQQQNGSPYDHDSQEHQRPPRPVPPVIERRKGWRLKYLAAKSLTWQTKNE